MRMTEPAARARAYDLMGLALNALGVRDDSGMRSVGGPCVEDADVNKQRHGYVSVGYGLEVQYTSFATASEAANKVLKAWVDAGHIATQGWTGGTSAAPEPALFARSAPDGYLMSVSVNNHMTLEFGVSSPCFPGQETAAPTAPRSSASAAPATQPPRADGGSHRIRDVLG
ncbi:hypothetical protein ACPA54_34640 [Uniformispora flossi]|uniref:hypothetical protein n=1 Tax=Uniformispora flossi TaxID=3390723 RepID=UPI003C2DB48C